MERAGIHCGRRARVKVLQILVMGKMVGWCSASLSWEVRRWLEEVELGRWGKVAEEFLGRRRWGCWGPPGGRRPGVVAGKEEY
jgi:hypothetical protein